MKKISIPKLDEVIEPRGFVYVAVNQTSDTMAEKSAKSLRANVGDAHITLFTDQNTISDVFDFIVNIPSRDNSNPIIAKMPHYPCQGIVAKARYFRHSPYEKSVFLDMDTYVCGDISDLFMILDEPYNFDFAARNYEAHTPLVELEGFKPPFCLPRYNTGVMAYRKSEATLRFFDKAWEYVLGAQQDIWSEEAMVSLAAHVTPGFRSVALPEEYNTRFIFPYILRYKSKILHGRSDKYPELARKINERDGAYRAMFEDRILGTYEAYVGFRG